MSPEAIILLATQVLRLINNIMEGIPVEQRQAWWKDNQKFWDDLIAKLSSGQFKLPEFKFPTVPPVAPKP